MRSWNLKIFAMRALDLKTLIANENLDVLLVCGTVQRRCKSGIITPLKLYGSDIAISAHEKSPRGRASIGIAFPEKRK